jgi:hypothetical protein
MFRRFGNAGFFCVELYDGQHRMPLLQDCFAVSGEGQGIGFSGSSVLRCEVPPMWTRVFRPSNHSYNIAMIKKGQRPWCVCEKHPAGPDRTYYLIPHFETRGEAEKEMKRLLALPEKAEYRLFVTPAPREKPKPRRLRKTTRR